MVHYDLFAGVGGFSYALDHVFYDRAIKHIFCEWGAFPTAVLKKHWPDATYYGDIADLVADTNSQRRERFSGEDKRRYGQPSGTVQNQEQEMVTSNSKRSRTRKNQQNSRRLLVLERCDEREEGLVILTGGFPCQPFSHAGRRQGTSDDRYKWPEMFAVIRNVRPDWVIAENVRGLVTWNDGMVLETVCADLESEGYEVQPLIIPAVAIGAPHRRDRVWIIANANPSGLERAWPEQQANGYRQRGNALHWESCWREVALATCHDGMDDGLPRWMDGAAISSSRHRKERLKACGNAIVPQVAIEIFKAIKLTTPQ